jgi:filamentous hemagglutinin family protein
MSKLFPRVVSILIIFSLTFYPVRVYADPAPDALPTGGSFSVGNGSIGSAGATMTVTQNADTVKGVVDWSTYNVGSSALVDYQQLAGASSITLNRVSVGNPSEIMGRITANGRIFIVNPSGILFGAGSQVDTAGLVASTLDISNADFMNGNYAFTGVDGAVINAGTLSSPGGFVALLGSRVANAGSILAELGTVALAAGNAVTVGLDTQNTISVAVTGATASNPAGAAAAVANSGTISANGGKVLLTADVLKGVFANAINTDGIIEANTMGDVNGQVILQANDRVNVAGTINAEGGTVTLNSQGVNVSADITADHAVFNMHDGDTFLSGASFSGSNSGTYSGSGSLTLYDNGNIFVTGSLSIVNGDLTLIADNDYSGSGDLTIDGASISLNSGGIWLEGANVYVTHGADIGITVNSVEGNSASSVIDIIAHGSDGELGHNGTVSITGDGEGGPSTVSAQLNGAGFAFVNIEGGNVTLDDAAVSAEATGGDDDWAGVNILGNTNVLDGSSVLAHTSSVMDGSQIYIRGGDILIDGSSLTAEVGGNANGSANIFLGQDPDDMGEGDIATHNISILNGSTVSAEMSNGNSNAEAKVEMDLTGTLDIEDSTITAVAGTTESAGVPTASIDLDLFSVNEEDPDVIISDSTLTAQVLGAGHAEITIYDTNPYGNPYWTDLFNGYMEGLGDMLNFNSDSSIPINGSITITGSTIQALAADPRSFSLSDIAGSFNNDSDTNFGASVGMMSRGPITLTDSAVSAQNENAPADVGIFSGSTVTIDEDSTVSATTDDSIALVGIAAMGTEEDSDVAIDLKGTVSADAGDGFGLVGLLGLDDVSISGNVSATGSMDVSGLVSGFLSDYLPEGYSLSDLGLDINLDNIVGSAVLVGSDSNVLLSGSVISDGQVDLLAMGDIIQNDGSVIAGGDINALAGFSIPDVMESEGGDFVQHGGYMETTGDLSDINISADDVYIRGLTSQHDVNVDARGDVYFYGWRNLIGYSDDVGTWVTLPFTFSFFDTDVTSVFVTTNGYLIPGSPLGGYFGESYGYQLSGGNAELPSYNIIAGSWSDWVDTVSAKADSDKAVFQWNGTKCCSGTGQINMQMILNANGSVQMNYGTMSTPSWGWGFAQGVSNGTGSSVIGPYSGTLPSGSNSVLWNGSSSFTTLPTAEWVGGTTGTTGAGVSAGRNVNIAAGGSIISQDFTTTDIQAQNAVLTAGGSIGSSENAIDTAVDNLTAIANNGDVYINEKDGVNLVDVQALGSTVDITTGGDTTVGNILAQGDGEEDPALVELNVEEGNLMIDGVIRASNLGGGEEAVDLAASAGSILGDADSLVAADQVYLTAENHIGTAESPINTDTSNLAAYSSDDPVWVSGGEDDEGGSYLYGTGNIYVNNIGTDLLNVGYAVYDYEDGEWYFDGIDPVQSGNGVVSVTTKGDMVVNSVIAYNGGVFLLTKEGSIYAGDSSSSGERAFSDIGNVGIDSNPNVIAGGASYFSAPNGTIGVGYPGEDKDSTVSAQILGIVDPGVTADTGLNPAPDIDLSQGVPSGTVWFNNMDNENGSQQVWPAAAASSVPSADNPLRVLIRLQEGAPSVIPASAVPAFGGPTGLMLQMGQGVVNGGDPSQLANLLAGNFRKFYETMDKFRYVPIDPVRPLGFFAYHPLNEADTSAFDGLALDTGAYDFIDGNLNYNGDFNPYYEEGKKKK